jgi:putative transposase
MAGSSPELIKTALERGLRTELTDHLGYEKGCPDVSAFPNSRNGSTPKTVATQVGDVDLAVPRDRDGTFIPRLVPKGSRDDDPRHPAPSELHDRHRPVG